MIKSTLLANILHVNSENLMSHIKLSLWSAQQRLKGRFRFAAEFTSPHSDSQVATIALELLEHASVVKPRLFSETESNQSKRSRFAFTIILISTSEKYTNSKRVVELQSIAAQRVNGEKSFSHFVATHCSFELEACFRNIPGTRRRVKWFLSEKTFKGSWSRSFIAQTTKLESLQRSDFLLRLIPSTQKGSSHKR